MRPCSGCNESISGKADRTYKFCEVCRKELAKHNLAEIDCYKEDCTGRAKILAIVEPEFTAICNCNKGHNFKFRFEIE